MLLLERELQKIALFIKHTCFCGALVSVSLLFLVILTSPGNETALRLLEILISSWNMVLHQQTVLSNRQL